VTLGIAAQTTDLHSYNETVPVDGDIEAFNADVAVDTRSSRPL
jgi:hypothetical protein